MMIENGICHLPSQTSEAVATSQTRLQVTTRQVRPRMSLLQCNMPTTWPTDYHVSHIRHVCTANTEAMPRDRPAGHSCKPSSGKSPADRDFLASTSLSVKIVTSVSRCARLCPRHHYQRARHLDSSPLRTLCLDDQADSPPTFLLAHSTPSMSCRHWR